MENGVQQVTRSGLSVSGSSLKFTYSPDTASETVGVRFDDIVVRKHVANEPAVILDKTADITLAATIPTELVFTLDGHAGACNGVGQTPGTSATAVSVSVGRLEPLTNGVAAQALSITTNAQHGYTIYVRSAGPPADSGGRTWADAPGTNAAPSSFPSPGTEAFGYTTSDATLGSGTPDRFTNPSAQWASLGTTNAEVAHIANGPANETICVAYQAGVSSTTAAGTYSTTVTYTAVPVF